VSLNSPGKDAIKEVEGYNDGGGLGDDGDKVETAEFGYAEDNPPAEYKPVDAKAHEARYYSENEGKQLEVYVEL